MKNLFYSFILLFAIGSMVSCTYDNEEELYGENACDTTLMVYDDVRPIFENNCVVCHNADLNYLGVELYSYEKVANVAASGRLRNAVNHLPGATPMPYMLDQLPDCSVKKITAWIDRGFPKN